MQFLYQGATTINKTNTIMRYTRKILETTWYFQFILLPVIILLSVVNVDRELSTKSVFHPSNVPAAARNYIETILLS